MEALTGITLNGVTVGFIFAIIIICLFTITKKAYNRHKEGEVEKSGVLEYSLEDKLKLSEEKVKVYEDMFADIMSNHITLTSENIPIYNKILGNNLASRLNQIKIENKGLIKKNGNYKKLVKDLTAKNKELKSKNRQKAKKIQKLQISLKNHKCQVEDLKNKRTKLRQEKDDLVSELISLKLENKSSSEKTKYYDEVVSNMIKMNHDDTDPLILSKTLRGQ